MRPASSRAVAAFVRDGRARPAAGPGGPQGGSKRRAGSGRSAFGLGPQPGLPLGMWFFWVLNYGALLQTLWWWWATPVMTLIVLFLSLYMVHVGLDEASNPRLRGTS